MSLSNNLTLVLPYADAARRWRVWALSEQGINFRRDYFRAQRCTMAFAALELRTYLSKSDPDLNIAVAGKAPRSGRFIEMRVAPGLDDDGFSMVPQGDGMIVDGHGRKGLLNGVYELLHRRGWRWLEPGPYGESAPPPGRDYWPRSAFTVIPSFQYRGMDAFCESQDSNHMLLWMARNRLNFYFRKCVSGKLADKLGMFSRKGGHILQRMLAPERCLPDGKTIWDAHPEWYGVDERGERSKKRIQLCVSQRPLLEFIGKELLRLLAKELENVDIIDMWGFDSWGKQCACKGCAALGNGADRNLFMLSFLRRCLDRARARGRLNRRVWLNIAAYEGTATLEAPSRPVPENLSRAGDMVIYYPIRRCYRHNLQDRQCGVNDRYRVELAAWGKRASGMVVWAGEYYNVSNFSNLPLLFTSLLPADMRFYYACGARGATYMHLPYVNWAMRALTQLQHARHAWNIDACSQDVVDDYLSRKYELYAAEMRQVYRLIEKGSGNISSWVSCTGCLSSRLKGWDGRTPDREIQPLHFDSDAVAIKACRRDCAYWREALRRIEKLLARERARNVDNIPPDPYYKPVNPQEADALRYYDALEYRLSEDCRLMVYGVDTLSLLLKMYEYYRALYLLDVPAADRKWREVERVSAKMAAYWAPITYEHPGVGLVTMDALSRTMLRKCVTRCRGARRAGRRRAGLLR